MIIGDRLRAMREDKHFSQGDIEKKTGLLRCYLLFRLLLRTHLPKHPLASPPQTFVQHSATMARLSKTQS